MSGHHNIPDSLYSEGKLLSLLLIVGVVVVVVVVVVHCRILLAGLWPGVDWAWYCQDDQLDITRTSSQQPTTSWNWWDVNLLSQHDFHSLLSSPLLPACWPLCIAVNVLDNLRNLLMEEPPSHTLIIIVHIGSSHSKANMEYWDISLCPAGQHWTPRNIVLYAEKVDRLWLCDCEIAPTN